MIEFFAICITVETLQAEICRKLALFEGVMGHFEHKFQRKVDIAKNRDSLVDLEIVFSIKTIHYKNPILD